MLCQFQHDHRPDLFLVPQSHFPLREVFNHFDDVIRVQSTQDVSFPGEVS